MEVREDGVQVDFQSTVHDSIKDRKSLEKRMSRAHSSVLLLDKSKSYREDINSDAQEIEIEENDI